MTLRYDGKVAVITGGGRGVGRAHAMLLAARGARVVVNDPGPSQTGDEIGEDPAGEVVREIVAAGGAAVADRHSVLDAGSVIATAVEAFGGVDILINNAGIQFGGLLAEMTAEQWWRVTDVHYRGTVDMTRAAWPHLARSGAGRVVNTASIAMLGNARATNYGSAKAGIYGFTRSAAKEGEACGVNVNCVLPSAWSRMTASIQAPAIRAAMEQRHGPEHVAAFAAWRCHGDTRVNGEGFFVGAGRAVRIVLASPPAVLAPGATPETWAAREAELLADGPLTVLHDMNEAFVAEMRDLAPGDEVLAREILGGVSSSAGLARRD